MICIPISAPTMDRALADLRAVASEPADLVELRLDAFTEACDLEALLSAAPVPCIVTCRPVREGGAYNGPEADRLAMLRRGAAAGAAYVDVEADAVTALGPVAPAKRIVSTHDFDETPRDLQRRVHELAALPGEVVKFATLARHHRDNLRIWDAMAACPKPVIGLGMGPLGEASRILALAKGGLLTFGSLAPGRESAPGQPTARDLADLYRVRSIGAATRLYAVLGNPIAHSVSPEIHNTAFRACGLDACYLRFLVEDLPDFLESFAPLELQGLSVTIPHKHAALACSTTVDPLAERVGAVNTLSRRGDGWHGDNTDVGGAMDAIRDAAARIDLPLAGARALLLGAGGAARGIACGLVDAGCTLAIANRTVSKAEALAAELGARALSLEDAAAETWDVVANSTSVGMHPHVEASPAPAGIFRPGMVVFDAVYNPRETRMLAAARAAGAAVADGVAMFVGQAVRQFEGWTGTPAPRAAMERVVVERLTGGGQ